MHNAFCIFCSRGCEHGVSVGRYVIMPDHIHLFVAMSESGPTLPKWIKGLRTVLGKQLLNTGVEKPHWQEGFFDHILRSSDSYGEKWDYVRMNPVRKGLSPTPEDWPFQGELNTLRF
jgi:putative transposase